MQRMKCFPGPRDVPTSLGTLNWLVVYLPPKDMKSQLVGNNNHPNWMGKNMFQTTDKYLLISSVLLGSKNKHLLHHTWSTYAMRLWAKPPTMEIGSIAFIPIVDEHLDADAQQSDQNPETTPKIVIYTGKTKNIGIVSSSLVFCWGVSLKQMPLNPNDSGNSISCSYVLCVFEPMYK